MSKNYGVKDIENWKFGYVEIPEVWRDHLGNVAENFRMLIQGPSGHGKTEYMLQLTKMLAIYYGKVHVNSTEQGKSPSFKEAFMRNRIHEIAAGKWMLADKSQRVFEKYFNKVQRPNSGRVLVIDSLDYFKLTMDQFKQLHERFPHKSIIIVCWDDPMSIEAKKIKYMCDIKVEVRDYRAKIRSRFGGNKDYIIWDKAAKRKQPSLFDN